MKQKRDINKISAFCNRLAPNIPAHLFNAFLSKGDYSLLEIIIKMNFPRLRGSQQEQGKIKRLEC